jgi:two-component sensor histidine kinase
MPTALDPQTLLETIVEGIGQPLYVLDADWRIIVYNEEAARYFGRPVSDMLGRTLWEVFPGDVTHARGKVVRDAMAGRKLVKGEDQSMMGQRWVSYCMFPVGSGLGVTFRDITDRRKAELLRDEAAEALRKRSVELEAVLETVPTAVWFTYDRDLRHVVGNRRATELLRLPRETDLSLAFSDPATFGVFRNGQSVPPSDRPLHRAARGEDVKDDLLEVAFDSGERRTMLFRAAPLRGIDGELQGAVCAAADVTERLRYEAHLRLLLSELNHRVKNTLAVVKSIASLTLKGTNAVALGDFEKRLIALSAVHSLLTDENWEGARLDAIVRTSLHAHLGLDDGRVHFEGDDLRLRPKSAIALSMALHELATNAVKYGALSSEQGTIGVKWTLSDGRFRMQWRETGGPPVVAPPAKGFGARMIEQGLSSELQGSARIDFQPGGVVCTIDAPLDTIREIGGLL